MTVCDTSVRAQFTRHHHLQTTLAVSTVVSTAPLGSRPGIRTGPRSSQRFRRFGRSGPFVEASVSRCVGAHHACPFRPDGGVRHLRRVGVIGIDHAHGGALAGGHCVVVVSKSYKVPLCSKACEHVRGERPHGHRARLCVCAQPRHLRTTQAVLKQCEFLAGGWWSLNFTLRILTFLRPEN